MKTKYIKPTEVINETLINRNYGIYKCKSLYDIAKSVIMKFCEINRMYGDVIIHIKIGNTGNYSNEYTSTEYAIFNGVYSIFEFINDFDEGEDYIVITDICYLHEVFEDEV